MVLPAEQAVCRFENADPDALNGVLSSSDVEHVVLGGPECCNALTRHWFCAGVCIDSGAYSFAVRARGSFPAKLTSIGYMRRLSAPTWVNGHHVDATSVEIYPAGCDLHYRAQRNSEWCSVAFDEIAVQEAALRRLGRTVDIPKDTTTSLHIPPPMRMQLLRWVERLRGQAEVSQTMMEGFLGNLAEFFAHVSARDFDAMTTLARRRLNLIAIADRYLREKTNSPFDLIKLANAVGTTPRTIQRAFLDAYGMTPREWSRRISLHLLRRRLRQPDAGRYTLEAIAAQFGFRHMGRFAQYYRVQFGELPSQTMKAL